MELSMNFDKNVIRSKVMEFLEINLTQEEDKNNFARLLKGNKLLYKEANSFIETLLKAFTIVDGKEDTPFVPRKVLNSKFLNKNVSIPLRNVLDQCGLMSKEVGKTYQSDHLQTNGQIAESALDHVYCSKSIEEKVEIKKLDSGSSDHNPVLATVKGNFKSQKYTAVPPYLG